MTVKLELREMELIDVRVLQADVKGAGGEDAEYCKNRAQRWAMIRKEEGRATAGGMIISCSLQFFSRRDDRGR